MDFKKYCKYCRTQKKINKLSKLSYRKFNYVFDKKQINLQIQNITTHLYQVKGEEIYFKIRIDIIINLDLSDFIKKIQVLPLNAYNQGSL